MTYLEQVYRQFCRIGVNLRCAQTQPLNSEQLNHTKKQHYQSGVCSYMHVQA